MGTMRNLESSNQEARASEDASPLEKTLSVRRGIGGVGISFSVKKKFLFSWWQHSSVERVLVNRHTYNGDVGITIQAK